jgi:glycosyltransferase involved in cell wall biosynthesis
MRDPLTASIVINNYNYGRFLRPCIDGALNQTYRDVEVIVVDDGSTDDSRGIISGYGDRVVPILKDNGGQASAFNAALPRCGGYSVLFLDADDTVHPAAVERAMARFLDPAVVKVQWRLRVVDESGNPLDRTIPAGPMPDGDLRDNLRRDSPEYLAPPQTSRCPRLNSEPAAPTRT